MNIYLNMLRHAGKTRTFDVANEGNPGGDAAAVAAAAAATKAAEDAAAAAAATKANDDAVKEAKDIADAAALAAAGGDPALVKLAGEKAELLREVMDKKTKLKAAQDEAATTKKALDAYEGIDPAEVKALVKAKKDAEKSSLEAKGDFDRVKTMMADEHAKELKTVKDQLDAERLERTKDRGLIDELTIGNAFGNSAYIKDTLILSSEKTRTVYGSHFEMKDGRLVGYNKPSSASDRTLLVNSAGAPLPFEEALERIVEADADKKAIMKSKAKPGGASSTTTPAAPGGKTVPAAKDDSGLYGRSRIAAGLKDFPG